MQLGTATSASAYGKAVWQITFSQNCDNAQYCIGGQGGLGGGWGWVALYSDGTGDMQVTECGHGGGGAGAFHEAVNIGEWTIDQANGVFEIVTASDPSFEGDQPVPAAPGHYNLHPAPGISFQITVSLNPTS